MNIETQLVEKADILGIIEVICQFPKKNKNH